MSVTYLHSFKQSAKTKLTPFRDRNFKFFTGSLSDTLPILLNFNCAHSRLCFFLQFANDVVWYQIRRYDAVGNRSCIATRFDMEGDTYIDVNFVEVVGEEVKRVEALARLDSAATGRFVVTFADSGGYLTTYSIPFKIITFLFVSPYSDEKHCEGILSYYLSDHQSSPLQNKGK